jgi:hypothetical protein
VPTRLVPAACFVEAAAAAVDAVSVRFVEVATASSAFSVSFAPAVLALVSIWILTYLDAMIRVL